MESIAGKIVLVTGGGRGLGEAICLELAEAGATVVSADLNVETAEKVVETIQKAGGQATAVGLDVTNETSIKQVIEEVIDRFGRIDILINNAGTDKTISIEELSVQDWDRVLDTNLRGPFLMSKYVFGLMKDQGGGQIINVASTAAKRAWANAAAYHSSKWGLLGFSYALHVEGRPCNIKVTTVIAGGMKTPFLLDRFPDIDIRNLQDPRNVAQAIRFVLMMPVETVIPELMVLPMRETSWP